MQQVGLVLGMGSRVQEMAGAEAGLHVWCAGSVRVEEIGVEGEEVGTFGEDRGEVRVDDFGDFGEDGRGGCVDGVAETDGLFVCNRVRWVEGAGRKEAAERKEVFF